jgi:hypothetical protein
VLALAWLVEVWYLLIASDFVGQLKKAVVGPLVYVLALAEYQ